MTYRKRILTTVGALMVLALALSACTPEPPALGSPENPLIFVFTPSGVQEEVVAGMEKVGALLEEQTGYTIETQLVNSYNAAVEALCGGKSHISHMGSFPYLIAHDKCGVEPAGVFIRYGSDTYGTQINARADSGFSSMADLEGKKPCWNDPLSASGYIVPQGLLGELTIMSLVRGVTSELRLSTSALYPVSSFNCIGTGVPPM